MVIFRTTPDTFSKIQGSIIELSQSELRAYHRDDLSADEKEAETFLNGKAEEAGNKLRENCVWTQKPDEFLEERFAFIQEGELLGAEEKLRVTPVLLHTFPSNSFIPTARLWFEIVREMELKKFMETSDLRVETLSAETCEDLFSLDPPLVDSKNFLPIEHPHIEVQIQ